MRRSTALDVLALLALAVAIHQRVVLGGHSYFDRDVEHFLAERLYAFGAALRAGALPLWNPFPAFGEPMLALAQAEFAYPTTWLAVLLPPDRTEAVIVVLHTALAGIGARFLAAELGFSRGAALLAGALWSGCGPLQAAVNQANVLVGCSIVPWAWLGFARAGRSGRKRDAVGAGLAVGAAMLAGSPESTLIACAGAALALHGRGQLSARERLRAAAGILLLAVTVGAGISAVQWLPTYDQARRSARVLTPESGRGLWSNHPASLALLALPLFPEELPLTSEVRDALFDGREPWLYSLYLGAATLALAGAGLLGPPRRGLRTLALIALVALLVSLGRFSPVWTLLQQLPLVGLMRFPGRFILAAALPLVLLAGAGADALSGPRHGSRARWLALAGATAVLAAVLASLAHPDAGLWARILEGPAVFGPLAASRNFMASLASLKAGALLSLPAALAALAAASRNRAPAALVALAGVAALGDLRFALRDLNPSVPREVLLRPPPALTLLSRERPNRTLVVRYVGTAAPRLLGRVASNFHVHDAPPVQKLWNWRSYPETSLGTPGFGIESVPGDVAALRDLRVERWTGTLWTVVGTPLFARLARLSGARYVISLHPLEPEAFTLLSAAQGHFEPVLTYAVRDPLPRAFAVAGVSVAREDGDAFARLADPGFDPRGSVVLPSGAEAAPAPAGGVEIVHLGFDRLELQAEMERPGHVVVLDSYDPGWRATVDGAPAPVLPANLLFRAVPVPAGRHRVELRYRPPAAAAGALVSGLTLLALAAGAVVARRQTPAPAPPAPEASA